MFQALASVHHQPKKKLPIQARLIARRVHKPMKAPRCCVRPGTVSLTGCFIADPKKGPAEAGLRKVDRQETVALPPKNVQS